MPEHDEPYRKSMTVCSPFGEYRNGEDEGEMTPERLRGIAARFGEFRRQVPIFLMGDHEFDLDARTPEGWVESLTFDEATSSLVAEVKLHGEAARMVSGDLVRGASIGTVQGKNPDGSSQGEVLQHLLLTNSPFDKSLNIAAARKGGEPVASYFTALGDIDMSTDELAKFKEASEKTITELRTEIDTLKKQNSDDRTEAMETLLRTRDKEVSELRAQNENLQQDVEKFQKDPKLEQAMAQLAQQERRILAATVRSKVSKGVAEGRFNIGQVGEPESGYDNGSDEVVLGWFKTSMFENSTDRLEFALSSFERKASEQRFNSGAPKGGDPVLNLDDKAALKRMGLDPDAVMAGMKSGNLEQFKELTAKK